MKEVEIDSAKYYVEYVVIGGGSYEHSVAWVARKSAVPAWMTNPPHNNMYVKPPFISLVDGKWFPEDDATLASHLSDKDVQSRLDAAWTSFVREEQDEIQKLKDLGDFWAENGNEAHADYFHRSAERLHKRLAELKAL